MSPDLRPCVVRLAFPDGTTDEFVSEKSTDHEVLAPHARALCAVRFRRVADQTALPWIHIFPEGLQDIRTAVLGPLEQLSGGRVATAHQ